MLKPASRRIGVDNCRRSSCRTRGSRTVTAIPWAIIARERPKVSRLGTTSSGSEYRSGGFIGIELGRAQQVLADMQIDRLELGCCHTNPEGQSRTIDLDPLAGHDLGLPVER